MAQEVAVGIEDAAADEVDGGAAYQGGCSPSRAIRAPGMMREPSARKAMPRRISLPWLRR